MTRSVLLTYVVLCLVAAAPSRAAILSIQRVMDYEVHFSGPNFDNATVDVTGTYTIGAGSSGSLPSGGGFPPLNQGITYFATGNVRVSPTSFPAGTTQVTTTVSATGSGTYGFKESFPPAGSYNDVGVLGPLGVYVQAGFQNLELFSPSNGGLDLGGTWITNFYFPGNWSRASNGDVPGTHQLLYLDPLWTISNDFVYNPATNKTLFSVINTNYPGGLSDDNGPYPDVALIGQAVPEPGTGYICGGGLAVAFLLKRWRRPLYYFGLECRA